jgi:hypothetical protein
MRLQNASAQSWNEGRLMGLARNFHQLPGALSEMDMREELGPQPYSADQNQIDCD